MSSAKSSQGALSFIALLCLVACSPKDATKSLGGTYKVDLASSSLADKSLGATFGLADMQIELKSNQEFEFKKILARGTWSLNGAELLLESKESNTVWLMLTGDAHKTSMAVREGELHWTMPPNKEGKSVVYVFKRV